jgi:hypothetical protein
MGDLGDPACRIVEIAGGIDPGADGALVGRDLAERIIAELRRSRLIGKLGEPALAQIARDNAVIARGL